MVDLVRTLPASILLVSSLLAAGCTGEADPEPEPEPLDAAPAGAFADLPWSYTAAGLNMCPQTGCVSVNSNSVQAIRPPSGGYVEGFLFELTEESAVEPGAAFHVRVLCRYGQRGCEGGEVLAQEDGPAPLTVEAHGLMVDGNATITVEVVWDRVTPPVLNAVDGQDTYTIGGNYRVWRPAAGETRELE